MLTDRQEPGGALNGTASCVLPPNVEDPRFPPSSIKYIFILHNHPFAGELSERDVYLAAAMANAHELVVDTQGGKVPLAVIAFFRGRCMTMPKLPLLLAVLLSGCMRNPLPSRAPLEDDKTIVFPQFFENEAVALGEQSGPYELDGETLRALMIAANDFLPPGTSNPPCRNTQEAQRYRVIRRGDILFVYIYEDHAYCGRQYPALDSGAKYAISKDGRILRRVLDGHPEGPLNSAAADVDDGGFLAEPGVSPTFDALRNEPPDAGHEEMPDGGSIPDSGSPEGPK